MKKRSRGRHEREGGHIPSLSKLNLTRKKKQSCNLHHSGTSQALIVAISPQQTPPLFKSKFHLCRGQIKILFLILA